MKTMVLWRDWISGEIWYNTEPGSESQNSLRNDCFSYKLASLMWKLFFQGNYWATDVERSHMIWKAIQEE